MQLRTRPSLCPHLPGLDALLGALLATRLLGDGLLGSLCHDGLLLGNFGSHVDAVVACVYDAAV